VLEHVLAQSANGPLLFSDRRFHVFVDASTRGKVASPEQLKVQSGYLREISQNVLYVGGKPVVFGAICHHGLVRQLTPEKERQDAPKRCLAVLNPRKRKTKVCL
jgi:hypothetical protein